jgi:glucosyl-dolichyl phosphate glucuronosyltransferase
VQESTTDLQLTHYSAEEPYSQPNLSGTNGHLDVSIVICAYTKQRWDRTHAAVESVLAQRPRPREILLVVDHNPSLTALARHEFTGVRVLESDSTPGLSGARNTGLRAATQPITVFLDDDAEARPGWLTSLIEPYRQSGVVATGGNVQPRWPTSRPRWIPPEFDWVVGCSYVGLPDSLHPVRNPIGANMSMLTGLALEAGGFDSSIGRVGRRPRGCEETELAIRLTMNKPDSVVLYVPLAVVDHYVGPERIRFRYFLRRCWHEGMSKAMVVRLVGSSAGLQHERRHAAVVIPTALARYACSFARGDVAASMRFIASVTGLTATALGYLVGTIRQDRPCQGSAPTEEIP